MINELEHTLLHHSKTYPLMQVTDAVKLIYQGEFGGGHLVRDRDECLARIKKEAEISSKSYGEAIEDIGFGIVRVNLASIESIGITHEKLCDLFIESASIIKGDLSTFFKKLECLSALTSNNAFSFTLRELDSYLEEYIKSGCPAVSHSEIYRNEYHPAYRIVLKSLL